MQQNSLKFKLLVHVLTTDLLEGRQKCVNQKKEINSVWILPSTRSESLLKDDKWVIQVSGNGKHDHFVANWVEFNYHNE